MQELPIVEERLRHYARAQLMFAAAMMGGMFIIIVLLTYSLFQAHSAALVRKDLIADNCRNIQAIRQYFGGIDESLTKAIRSAPPGSDLTVARQFVDEAREARLAMSVTHCPGGDLK